MREFLFSPYFDINLPIQSDLAPPRAASSVSLGNSDQLAAATTPRNIKALTLAFATGECGNERWSDLDAGKVAASIVKSLLRDGIEYVISTGGAKGIFTCSSERGMEEFIAHYNARGLLGFDFDIEAGQSESMISNLVEQVRIAMRKHPHLRFSFTLAALSSTQGGQASLNQHGDLVMKAIARSGLTNYFINLMVMNYGEARSENCVVEDQHCDMAASAIKVVQNFSHEYGLPLQRIEVTPMIGMNDVTSNVFTLNDARTLALFVSNSGLGGLHFWSLNRDQPCAQTLLAVSPICSSIEGPGKLEFANTFALNFS
jgi:hypothetical protein